MNGRLNVFNCKLLSTAIEQVIVLAIQHMHTLNNDQTWHKLPIMIASDDRSRERQTEKDVNCNWSALCQKVSAIESI